ncbi:MAG: glutathione S-transferase family protein [Caulobacteraceae bacterium]|nr:glutathione S-transferase family protein [Caulobacteraceae bacterium]
MLKLFYAPGSCALASHIALEEAGADYELALVKTGENQQRTPEYLAINPKGRVPALQTDRGILSENPAILAYVAQTHPQARLIPEDAFAFAEIQAFNAFLCATVHPTFAHKWRPYRYADDPAAHAAMGAKVPSVLDEHFGLVEAQLSDGREWLFGDYSIADCYLHVFARWYQRPGLGTPASRPLVQAHIQRMQRRPAVARALEQEGAPIL